MKRGRRLLQLSEQTYSLPKGGTSGPAHRDFNLCVGASRNEPRTDGQQQVRRLGTSNYSSMQNSEAPRGTTQLMECRCSSRWTKVEWNAVLGLCSYAKGCG